MYKVLIAEDEKLIRKGLVFMVDWMEIGCSVPIEACNGKQGLEIIKEQCPDIVITDVKMPLMDGIEMIGQGLREHSFESIIISGHDEFSYAQTAIRLGVSDYLLKPVDMAELQAAILRLAQKLEKSGKPASETEGGVLGTDVIDISLVEHKLKTSSRHVSVMLRYIRDQYAQKISLKAISKELDISATYLNQKFKEETSYTFNDLLNRYRIQMAVKMLMTGTYKIYEISQQCGFLEYRYFSAVFKKYVGCTPTEYSEAHCRNNILPEQENIE